MSVKLPLSEPQERHVATTRKRTRLIWRSSSKRSSWRRLESLRALTLRR